MPVLKKCEVCSKEFSVPPVRAATAKVCSQKCRGVSNAKGYQEKRIKFRCKWCDKELEVPKCHEARRVYCSTKCKASDLVGTSRSRTDDGAVTMHSWGYVLERELNHPFAVKRQVMQHRLVMERWMREEVPDHHFLVEIGGVKYLRREIHVHHRNEVKHDNERTNLLACTAATHRDIHTGRPVMSGTSWPESGNEVAPEKRSFVKPCGCCGKQITVMRSNVIRGGGKYCSRSCAAISRAEGQRATRAPKLKPKSKPEAKPIAANNFSTLQGKYS